MVGIPFAPLKDECVGGTGGTEFSFDKDPCKRMRGKRSTNFISQDNQLFLLVLLIGYNNNY